MRLFNTLIFGTMRCLYVPMLGQGQVVVWRFLNDDLLGSDEAQQSDSEFTIYPNPTTGFSQLKWTLEESATVSCELVDMQGRTLQTLLKESSFPARTHQVQIQINESLLVNIALVKLNIDGQTTVKPIVICR